jgi:imidazole glycerol-phosphate synthase subunit HisH
MAERLVIIDYGSGNLRSAAKALQRAADDAGLAVTVAISADAAEISSAAVIENAKPFLGICVGMQLMAREGHEHGTHKGLGWLDSSVSKITPSDKTLKIPHMGWNIVSKAEPAKERPMLRALPDNSRAYFVHSYAMTGNAAWQLATTDYGGPITAIVGRDNMIGTQFHPEKSQAFGIAFLTAFLKWKP